MPPKRKKNVKDPVIPPLDFIGSPPSERIPINNEYIPCTSNYPKVRMVPSEMQPIWIEPHFDFSQINRPLKANNPPPQRKSKRESAIGPLNFSSDGSPIVKKARNSSKKRGMCPLFPLVVPKPPLRSAIILIPESPQH